jgi:hypothetical protein
MPGCTLGPDFVDNFAVTIDPFPQPLGAIEKLGLG